MTMNNGGYGYNRLEGKAREWAANNKFARSEYCVRVVDGKRFGGPEWIKKKCGDGRMGFLARRKGRDEVKMEQGLDGQFKRRRSTLLNKRSARSTVSRHARRIDGSKVGLISSANILKVQRDPVLVAKMEGEYRKIRRKRRFRDVNHHVARRAAKRNHKTQIRMVA